MKTIDKSLSFSVSMWGSNPDETDNDDCWISDDFATLAEAEAAYADPASMGKGAAAEMRNAAYIMLDGPDAHSVRKNPAYRPSRRDDDSNWQREIAMEAGMAFGCDGYNDVMGY